mgnify:CR=1 FL=1
MAQTAKASSPLGQTFLSLRYRDFRLVWAGSVTEHMGEWMELTAFFWLARHLTPSPFLLTFIGFARFIPPLLFSFPGGLVTDLVDRRKLLITALLTASLLSVVLSILVYTERIAIWNLVVIALLNGVIISFNHPARQAILPNLVKREHLMNAISLDTISVMASSVIGAPLGGWMIDRFGVAPIFLWRALGLVLAIGWLAWVKTPLKPPASRKETLWQNISGGIRYLKRQPTVGGLVALYILPMTTFFVYLFLLPTFAKDILQVTGSGFGILNAASGLGAVISLVALASVGDFRRKGMVLLAMAITMGLTLWGFGASHWFWVTFLLLLISGASRTSFMTINATVIQKTIPDEVRGRVMSLREVATGLGPIGSLIAGGIAQLTTTTFAVEVMGIVTLLIPLALVFWWSGLKKLE